MSIPAKKTMPCPHCHTPMEVTVWQSVNTNLSPDLPQKLISGDFFCQQCPHCGGIFFLQNTMLYHDLKHRAMIWLVWDGEDREQKLLEIRNTTPPPGYTVRIVRNMAELQEKVSILEAGRDDRIIEIIKHLCRTHRLQLFPDNVPVSTRYIRDDEGERFEFQEEDGQVFPFPLTEQEYRRCGQLLRETVPNAGANLDIIDPAWSAEVFPKMLKGAMHQATIRGISFDQYVTSAGLRFRAAQEFPGDPFQKISEPPPAAPASQRERFGTRPAVQFTAPPPPPAPPKRARRWLIPVLSVLALIAFFGVLIYFSWGKLQAVYMYELSISDDYYHVHVGDSQTISYTADLGELPDSAIVWTSSEPDVVSVSDTGTLHAHKEGFVTIVASVNGAEMASCDVIVDPKPKPAPKPVPIQNGEMVISPGTTSLAEVTVNAPKNASCLVYFKSTSWKTITKGLDFAFFVKAGSSATVNAPTGSYTLYYATGDTWYGRWQKFGEDTQFFTSPDTFTLEVDDSYYDVLELTLYAVPNGNMETTTIGAEDFPI